MHLTANRPGTTIVQFAEWCESILTPVGSHLTYPALGYNPTVEGALVKFTMNGLDFYLGVNRCTAQGIVNAYWLACQAEPRAKASATKDA
jgi:hypothetical protein